MMRQKMQSQWGRLAGQKNEPRNIAESGVAREGSPLLEDLFSTPAQENLSPQKVQAILEERARALASVEEMSVGDTMQVVVFSLADETYGITTDHVREVQPLRNVSPVPCTPRFVVGVVNIRGAIYSVIDVRSFLGVSDQAITEWAKVILVDAADLEVGILADDVLGEINVPLAEIRPPLANRGSIREEYVRGVTREMLSILNLEALLRDERIIVHEEVS
ncbi:MAG: chemotaxis protein CheW [Chloroflexota bacterium]